MWPVGSFSLSFFRRSHISCWQSSERRRRRKEAVKWEEGGKLLQNEVKEEGVRSELNSLFPPSHPTTVVVVPTNVPFLYCTVVPFPLPFPSTGLPTDNGMAPSWRKYTHPTATDEKKGWWWWCRLGYSSVPCSSLFFSLLFCKVKL